MDEELDDLVYEWVDVSDDDEESSETMSKLNFFIIMVMELSYIILYPLCFSLDSCRPSAKEDYQLALKIAIKRLNLMKKLGFKVIR